MNKLYQKISCFLLLFTFCGVAVNAAETDHTSDVQRMEMDQIHTTSFVYPKVLLFPILLLETRTFDPGNEYYYKDGQLFINLYNFQITQIKISPENRLPQAVTASLSREELTPFLLPTPEGDSFKISCSEDKKRYILLTVFNYPTTVSWADVAQDYTATLIDDVTQTKTPLADIVVTSPDTLSAPYAFCDGKNQFFYFTGSAKTLHKKPFWQQGIFAYNLKDNSITAIALNKPNEQIEAFSPMDIPGTNYYIYIRQNHSIYRNDIDQVWLNKKLKQPENIVIKKILAKE